MNKLSKSLRSLVLIGAILCLGSWSLQGGFRLISSFATKANALALDNFGNFYTVANNRIEKYSKEGKLLFPYEEFRFGKVGMVDATNPMKLLVYYPDYMTIVTLDRFLSPLNTYDLFSMGYQNVSAVASSADGRIWFYDNVDFKLKKIDEFGKMFRESQALNVILGQTPNPNFIQERDNRIYMNDPELGILVFDLFGSYAKTIPIKGLKKFQVLQDQIVYFENNQLNAYQPLTFELKTLPLPDTTDLVHVVIEKDMIGLLKKDKVEFFAY